MAATAYITTSTMASALGDKIYEILNVASGASISSNAALLDAIEEACAIVDGAVRAKYAPADVITNGILTGAAKAICRYKLVQKTRPELVPGEAVSQAYTDAMATLEKVAKGSAKGGFDLAFQPSSRSEDLATAAIDTFQIGSATLADGERATRKASVMLRESF